MNNNAVVLLAAGVSLAIMFSSCGSGQTDITDPITTEEATPEAITNVTTHSIPEGPVITSDMIIDDFTERNVHVAVNAEIDIPDISSFSDVELGFSHEIADKAVDVLINRQYPELEAYQGPNEYIVYDLIKKRDEDELPLCQLTIEPDAGFHYFEAINNINNEYQISGDGQDHEREYEYIADVVPEGMQIKAEDAASQVAEFFERFSIFTFCPNNVCAYNNMLEDNKGFYRVVLTACYHGVPILAKNGPDVSLPIMPQAYIANTGIFDAQGAVIFDVIEERPVESVVSLEDVYSSFRDRITVIAEGNEVEVSRISLAYLPSTLQNGNRLLVPAWVFECTDRRIENGRYVTNKISVLFRADNGDYWDVFF